MTTISDHFLSIIHIELEGGFKDNVNRDYTLIHIGKELA